jgi:signal peptidase I
VVEAYRIPSGSMIPTLFPGDHIYVAKSGFTVRRGDVIVFPGPGEERVDFVKRVVALPGDRVAVEGGHLILNGTPVPRCRVGAWSNTDADRAMEHRGDLFVEAVDGRPYLIFLDSESAHDDPPRTWTVKPDEVFVLGDNRNNAYDSRAWFGGEGGGLPIATIRGRVLKVWLALGPEGVQWDRMGAPVDGAHLPPSAPQLAPDLAKCLHDLGVARD